MKVPRAAVARARGLGRGLPAARTARRDLGRRPDPRHRGPGARDRDPGGLPRPAGAEVVPATHHDDSILAAVHAPACWSTCAPSTRSWLDGGVPRRPGPGPGRAVRVPHRRAARRVAAARPGRRARQGGPVLLRHDDAGGARDVGGRPGRGRRDPHRRRPGPYRAGPLAYALCRPPGHHAGRDSFGGSCYLNNAAVAAHGCCAAGHGGSLSSTSTPTTATARSRCSTTAPTCFYGVAARRPGGRLVPALRRLRRRDRPRGGRRQHLNVPLAPGTGTTAWLAALDRHRRCAVGARRDRARRVARRGRRRGRPREPAAGQPRRVPRGGPVRGSARWGCPRSPCRRAATTSTPSAAWSPSPCADSRRPEPGGTGSEVPAMIDEGPVRTALLGEGHLHREGCSRRGAGAERVCA
jgi:hypothetical protein